MASYQEVATQVAGEVWETLTLDEVLRQVGERQPIKSANPKHTIRQALTNSQSVATFADGHYVYIPRALTGSSFRIPLGRSSLLDSRLALEAEVAACLRAARRPSPGSA